MDSLDGGAEQGGSVFGALLRDWRRIEDSRLSSWRASYLEELGRLAEELRPRFASGELRAMTDGDIARDGGATSPFYAVERLCCAHFRLEELDPSTLRLLLDVSPHASAIADAGWTDDVYWLQSAIAWDLIALARARGMYLPAAGELPDPAAGP
jgi:hypothetical protein